MKIFAGKFARKENSCIVTSVITTKANKMKNEATLNIKATELHILMEIATKRMNWLEKKAFKFDGGLDTEEYEREYNELVTLWGKMYAAQTKTL